MEVNLRLEKLSANLDNVLLLSKSKVQRMPAKCQLSLPEGVESLDATESTAQMGLAALDIAFGSEGVMVVLMCLISSTRGIAGCVLQKTNIHKA